MNMKRIFSLMIVYLWVAGAFAEVIKVDFNMSGRSEQEVNEPNYIPWVVGSQPTETKQFGTVRITLNVVHPIGDALKTGWVKANIGNPYYARLVSDGVTTSSIQGGDIEMRISGLPMGSNSIQTYHNTWNGPTANDFCPINVYVNGILTHANVHRSNRALRSSDATRLFTTFEVSNPAEETVLLFESVKDFVAEDGKTAEINVCINGFEIGVSDAANQARNPLPADRDFHANADSGQLTLRWSPAPSAVEHRLYIGTDSSQIASIKTGDSGYKARHSAEDTSYVFTDVYSLNTYYWRIDEVHSSGEITQGNIWRFRPRQLAFIGAEGYGRFATGGRGGAVVVVSNLNDDGPGSFREAITNDIGPRTIVFNVSGIISLKSRLTCSSKYVTIAGQTAPGKGICIRSAPFGLGSESILRFLRVRLGGGQTYDGLGMAGANHSIIDHCSVSWTIDEAFSSRNSKNITLQKTLISEALNIAGHQNYPEGTAHGYAATIGGDIGSFHHNLLAHCYGRNWSLGGGLDGAGYYAGRLDIFNNVVYNWGSRATDGGAHEVNFVNNYYKKGPATTQFYLLKADLEGTGKGSQSYYYAGNQMASQAGNLLYDGSNNALGRTYTTSNGQIVDWQVFVNQAFFPSYASIQSGQQAYRNVLTDVGCNRPVLDDHDKRILQETASGTYTYTGSKSKLGGIIDDESEAGGYEAYPEISRSEDFDSDLDGLPNWWELVHGSNPHSEKGDYADSNSDADKDGFTMLEDYLEWMSHPSMHIQIGKPDTLDLTDINPTLNSSCLFSVVSTENLQATLTGSKLIVSSKRQQQGIDYLDVRIQHPDQLQSNLRISCLTLDATASTNSVSQKGPIRIRSVETASCLHITLESQLIGEAQCSITTTDGKSLYKQSIQLYKGIMPLEIPLSRVRTNGMLILQILPRDQNTEPFTEKLLIL